MNKALLTALLFIPLLSFAQTDTIKQKHAFCLVQIAPVPSSRYEIYIDEGQRKSNREMELKDEKGKPVRFGSIIAILEYMERRKCVMISSYGGLNANDLTFVFKRGIDMTP